MARQKGQKTEYVVFGGGCFWCLEAAFAHVRGVVEVVSGYAGGKTKTPTYEKVSSGKTGHAEVVKVTFDPKAISYQQLLRIFFSLHDPTTPNRQGNDVGTQYRSIVLYQDDKQLDEAEKVIMQIARADFFGRTIVTELEELKNFYPAEEYHQRYFEKNPEAAYCQLVVTPKLAKLRAKFAKYYA